MQFTFRAPSFLFPLMILHVHLMSFQDHQLEAGKPFEFGASQLTLAALAYKVNKWRQIQMG